MSPWQDDAPPWRDDEFWLDAPDEQLPDEWVLPEDEPTDSFGTVEPH